jgi:hypothetical protein
MSIAGASSSTTADVEGTALDAVVALRDDLGVLSVYLNAEHRCTTALHGKGPVARVIDGFGAHWSKTERTAVAHRIAEIEPRALRDQRPPDVGFFVGLASGAVIELPVAAAVPACAAVDQIAHTWPLVKARQHTRAVGVAIMSTARLVLLEVAEHNLTELYATDIAATERERGSRHGNPGAPSAPARQPGPARDQHARRRAARLATATAGLADRVAAEAYVRGWDAVVVSGNRELLTVFSRRMPTNRIELIESDTQLDPRNRRALMASVASTATELLATQTARVLASVIDDPATVWGIRPVLAALNRRRVARLVLAGDLDAAIAERLVRGALASGAGLTFADAGVLGPLAVAARPRW